ncbi:MAG: hypothetical protein MKZ57_01620 [Candidatus Poseidoniaceae archaeon]|nr:hypothetical protein [Candidatus Poseidoniaceae archaeon]
MIDENAFDLPETFEEEDIDIFAELGVAGGRPINNATDQQQQQNENLAILLSDNESVDSVDEEVLSEPNVVIESNKVHLPDKTISELLEILVKQELHSSEGKEIINNIPENAKLNLESAKVTKNHDEYEISVIINVDGSGPVRPFAKIKSENNVLSVSGAPNSIPNKWVPLYDILRDLLTKAMQMLSSTKFTINNNI